MLKKNLSNHSSFTFSYSHNLREKKSTYEKLKRDIPAKKCTKRGKRGGWTQPGLLEMRKQSKRKVYGDKGKRWAGCHPSLFPPPFPMLTHCLLTAQICAGVCVRAFSSFVENSWHRRMRREIGGGGSSIKAAGLVKVPHTLVIYTHTHPKQEIARDKRELIMVVCLCTTVWPCGYYNAKSVFEKGETPHSYRWNVDLHVSACWYTVIRTYIHNSRTRKHPKKNPCPVFFVVKAGSQ